MTRQHFHSLDALRGVAALGVLLGHTAVLFPSGYVFAFGRAVDFFFILSGFIIAHVYGEKLERRQISIRSFFLIRLVRFYPMVLLGSVIGLAFRVAEGRFSFTSILVSWAFAAMMLPVPRFDDPAGSSYPINPPEWSLTHELATNMLLALAAPWLRGRSLVIATAIAIAALTLAAIDAGSLRFMTEFSSQPLAFLRALAGLLIGVLIYRLDFQFSARVPVGWLGAILVAVFLMPLSSQNALTDLVSVLGVCPLLVAFGRHSEAKWPALADWLGAISYPLYAIHYPILLLTSHYLGNAPWAGAFGCLTAIGISQAALKFYDEPMRAWARSRRWSLKSPFL